MPTTLKNLTPFAVILFFFLMLFAFTKLAGPVPFSVNSVSTVKQDSFYVSGEGKVSVIPDVVVVNAGITAEAASVKAVQETINASINKISGAVKGLGVDEKDIKTTNYNINPNYDFTSGTQRITGYSGSTNLEIKVRNTDNANQVIDTATQNGANQISGITFDVSDKSKAQDEARVLAIADAKKKAEAAAKTAGFTLGKMINYQESFIDPISPMPYAANARLEIAKDAAGSAAPLTDVQLGSSELTLTVSLSYEIQ